MIFENFIEKETAILAKTKGFDEPCGDLWGVVDGYEGRHHWNNVNHLCNEKQFSAPTQTVLQKWLREKHGLILCVIYTNVTGIKWGYDIYGRGTVYVGNSYEECLEFGLKEALTLIK